MTLPLDCNDSLRESVAKGDQSGGGVKNLRGLVLAGGKSRRFGQDKASAMYKGKRLLEHAVGLLTALHLKPIVVTRLGVDYPFLNCPILYDKLPEMGPLGGIYTAMNRFKKVDFIVLTCDMPDLGPTLALQLLEHLEDDYLTVFSHRLVPQPFPGIYPSSLCSLIGQRLIQNNLSMAGLIEASSHKKILSWTGSPEAFLNVNRKEDIPFLSV